jgi:hypothetical protein
MKIIKEKKSQIKENLGSGRFSYFPKLLFCLQNQAGLRQALQVKNQDEFMLY